MALFTKRYHMPGTEPGTLVEQTIESTRPLRIQVADYNESDFNEIDVQTVEELGRFITSPTTTWIHFDGYCPPEVMEQIGGHFGLHSLAMEDIMNSGQRPKTEIYDGNLFVILAHAKQENGVVYSEQLSFFLSDNLLLSFYNGINEPFNNVRKRLCNRTAKLRGRKADYLLYALVDTIVDEAFPLLEAYGELVEDLDEELLDNPTKLTLQKIHRSKRELLLIRRILWPQREIVNTLIRDEDGLLEDNTKIHLRDCYDHTIQTIEMLEIYREVVSNMFEVYLSSLSNRTNEIMRILTIIATIFIPLTFIVGVYGMNFGNNTKSPWAMPELFWYYSYPVLWLIMLTVAAVMLLYFKRKQWL